MAGALQHLPRGSWPQTSAPRPPSMCLGAACTWPRATLRGLQGSPWTPPPAAASGGSRGFLSTPTPLCAASDSVRWQPKIPAGDLNPRPACACARAPASGIPGSRTGAPGPSGCWCSGFASPAPSPVQLVSGQASSPDRACGGIAAGPIRGLRRLSRAGLGQCRGPALSAPARGQWSLDGHGRGSAPWPPAAGTRLVSSPPGAAPLTPASGTLVPGADPVGSQGSRP